jgi:hypothetical protein
MKVPGRETEISRAFEVFFAVPAVAFEQDVFLVN